MTVPPTPGGTGTTHSNLNSSITQLKFFFGACDLLLIYPLRGGGGGLDKGGGGVPHTPSPLSALPTGSQPCGHPLA